MFPHDGGPVPATAPVLTTGLSPPEAPEAGDTDPLAVQARDHYRRAIEAQRRGDWALYGEELKKLGEVLERMSSSQP